MKKIAIIGMGYVGKGMLSYFPNAVQYDKPLGIGTREEVNACDLAIICVPTPPKEDGRCDTSIVEDVLSWLETPLILIKSAVEPGFSELMAEQNGQSIVVSPEYMGESKYFIPDRYLDPKNPLKHEFLILGGETDACEAVADIFAPVVGPATRIRFMTSTEAEMVKYMENSFFAMKVTYANEMRDICKALGISWHRVREGWIDDPRINPMHTAVFPDARGFGGRCYPKDTRALHNLSKRIGAESKVLRAVLERNETYR